MCLFKVKNAKNDQKMRFFMCPICVKNAKNEQKKVKNFKKNVKKWPCSQKIRIFKNRKKHPFFTLDRHIFLKLFVDWKSRKKWSIRKFKSHFFIFMWRVMCKNGQKIPKKRKKKWTKKHEKLVFLSFGQFIGKTWKNTYATIRTKKRYYLNDFRIFFWKNIAKTAKKKLVKNRWKNMWKFRIFENAFLKKNFFFFNTFLNPFLDNFLNGFSSSSLIRK